MDNNKKRTCNFVNEMDPEMKRYLDRFLNDLKSGNKKFAP